MLSKESTFIIRTLVANSCSSLYLTLPLLEDINSPINNRTSPSNAAVCGFWFELNHVGWFGTSRIISSDSSASCQGSCRVSYLSIRDVFVYTSAVEQHLPVVQQHSSVVHQHLLVMHYHWRFSHIYYSPHLPLVSLLQISLYQYNICICNTQLFSGVHLVMF